MNIYPPRYLHHTGVGFHNPRYIYKREWGPYNPNNYWNGEPIETVWLSHKMREEIVREVNAVVVTVADLPKFLQYRTLNPKRY